jgi:hypothetical protein
VEFVFFLGGFCRGYSPLVSEFSYVWAFEELMTRSLGPEIRLILPPW